MEVLDKHKLEPMHESACPDWLAGLWERTVMASWFRINGHAWCTCVFGLMTNGAMSRLSASVQTFA